MRSPVLLAMLALLLIWSTSHAEESGKIDPGVLPLGADGKPLNLDFETGDLKDWTLEGVAFKDQPIKGDTVSPRRADMKSQHQGNFWIGGYEKFGDKPQGTLTSVAFKVTHPWASFLVGGGPHAVTCVELVRKDTNGVVFRVSGLEEENLRRVAVDLSDIQGKEIFIRIVDRHAGHWGHVNFDDFRFHTNKPSIPTRPKTNALDVYKHAGLKPEDAAKAMTVPEGFSVKLFAGEPDVQQPIALCLDDRGRIWVAEAYCYPRRQPEGQGKDRILIFEDVDGDGKFDKRTVFMEGLNLVSGLEVGFGGVWIGAAPYLMFVPVKEGEDKPAGDPQILLDGWAWQDTHETLNTFMWGPDGWLYGCHGVFTHSRVGKPGTADKDRIPINAGVWRYHPTRHVFEVFAHGTSNPWGLDFNQFGHAFVEACVIPHNWYIIQGGRYQRQAGAHFNPYTYDDIKTIAEHRHYVGATPHGGNNRSDEVGGGHAHCGTMIYLGGTWPKRYHGKMFMGNVHGHRLNIDTLTPKGTGYVASRHPDFLLANDAWARFINLTYGPDGNVYLIDWYDKQACHHNDPKIWDRGNGRIYKIVHKDASTVKGIDLQKESTEKLIELQSHPNQWYVRHARRILHERIAKGDTTFAKHLAAAEKLAFDASDEVHRLHGLWLFHVHEQLTPERVKRWLKDVSPHVRAWTVRLLAEQRQLAAAFLPALVELAQNDPSPVVRLSLASALQKLPAENRWEIARHLIARTEDVNDHNQPYLLWYGIEPLADVDAMRALTLVAHSEFPTLLPFMTRRVATLATPEALGSIVQLLGKMPEPSKQLAILQATNEALKGRRQVEMPKGWANVFTSLTASPSAEVRSQATALALTFGDANAFAGMRKVLMDTKADSALRLNALAALLGGRDKELAPILHQLLDEPALRSAALKGLAAYDDPKTPGVILARYAALNSEERRDALNTLASRPAYAKELLQAVQAKGIAASDVTADIVRSMMNLNDAAIEKQLAAVWGVARRSPAERLQLIAETKKKLLSKTKQPSDLALGRAMYQKTCAQCHTLYGEGGKIGPEITGSNRANLDYLLENILDPSAVIPKDYAVSIFNLDNGRKITGIVKQETDVAVTVQTANEVIVLPKKEIESRKPSDLSMMPDDILKTLKEEEFRSLIAYLQHPQQVPMLATSENAKDFFNGKDLTNWTGESKLWKVENGEIVGRSPGINKNEFLKSSFQVRDFRLTVKVKLTPNKENSGIQFRSEVLPNGDVKGYQADIGQGWWGKLYEEHGRALLWDKSGEEHIKAGEWNEYVIEAVGSRIRTFLNGKPCVDLNDPAGAKQGIIALQIHSGGPMEVRFKDLKLEVLPPKKK